MKAILSLIGIGFLVGFYFLLQAVVWQWNQRLMYNDDGYKQCLYAEGKLAPSQAAFIVIRNHCRQKYKVDFIRRDK